MASGSDYRCGVYRVTSLWVGLDSYTHRGLTGRRNAHVILFMAAQPGVEYDDSRYHECTFAFSTLACALSLDNPTRHAGGGVMGTQVEGVFDTPPRA